MRLVLLILLAMTATGCSAIDMEQYKLNTPRLDVFEFFNGETKGWGIVQDRKGNMTRQFIVSINGTATENSGLTLVENFDWNDGEKTQRIWHLLRENEHVYSGRADDVVGSAEGTLYGNVLNWQYQLNLKVDGTNWKIKFDDWMFLVSEDLLLNKAVMTKFGIKVGEVTIVFRK